MKNNSQNKPKRASMRTPKRKPDGFQWQLDQELQDQLSIQERLRSQESLPLEERFALEQRLLRLLKSENPERDVDNFPDSAAGEGYPYINFNSGFIEDIEPPHPPPAPPSPQDAEKPLYPDGPRPCLYEYPETREWIRNKVVELGVTNVNQLLRTHTAAELLEAIIDYERALDDGFRVRYPTAYFRSLLK